jgi:hypothetical protein
MKLINAKSLVISIFIFSLGLTLVACRNNSTPATAETAAQPISATPAGSPRTAASPATPGAPPPRKGPVQGVGKIIAKKGAWLDTGVFVSPSQTVSVVADPVKEPFSIQVGNREKDAVGGPGMGFRYPDGKFVETYVCSLLVVPANYAPNENLLLHTDQPLKVYVKVADKASVDHLVVLVILQNEQLKPRGK